MHPLESLAFFQKVEFHSDCRACGPSLRVRLGHSEWQLRQFLWRTVLEILSRREDPARDLVHAAMGGWIVSFPAR